MRGDLSEKYLSRSCGTVAMENNQLMTWRY